MAIRKIVTMGHPSLSRRAEPCGRVDDEIRALARDMIETLHAAPGLGLAAPQVDVCRRVIVVDLSVGERPEELTVLVDPEILSQAGESISEEGCLSVPGVQEKVTRPARVRVRGLDLEGRETVLEAEGLKARVFCHEIDHLEGRLFIDRLSPLKKALLRKRLRKANEALRA